MTPVRKAAIALQLRRDEVLRGARALLDEEGLDGLTMRRLGASLKAPAGGLDRFFAGRQALLEAVAEDLVSGVAETPPAGPWDQRLATLAHRLRRALLSVRDGARLVAETFVVDPVLVRTGVRILVEDTGLPVEQAAWTVITLSHYVLGHAIEEQSPPSDRPARADPELGAAITADPGRRFEFGLVLVLDGIRRRVEATGP